MIFTVGLVGVIAMILSQLDRARFKYGLECAWMLIFAFLALRYNFGNDYNSYYTSFNYISAKSTFAFDESLHFEKGWQLLCWIFKPIGFFGMVACLTAFECYVYYRLIKKFVPKNYYWLSIFLYVFTPGLMLIGSSMLRNQLAITIFLCSLKFIFERRVILYLLMIFLASTIHSSAIILYPLILLGYRKEYKFNTVVVFIILIGFILLSYWGTHLTPIVEQIATVSNLQDKYETYSSTTRDGITYGLGSLLQLILFAYMLFRIKYTTHNIHIICMLFIIGKYIEPFSATIPMVARLLYYFSCYAMLLYPIVLSREIELSSNRWSVLRPIMLVFLVLLTFYSYYSFFQDPVWVKAYSSYQTILFAV